MLKIETLKTFVEVAQSGSLATAASRLGRTPSALSMSLKLFETDLGQKLFEGERKDRLSPFGKDVFDLAVRQIKQFDATVDAIEARAASEHGLLRIASIPSAAATVFPSLLDRLIAEFPSLNLDLRDADSAQVLASMRDGVADIGIASGAQQVSGLTSTVLFQDRFGLVVSGGHPLHRSGRDVTVDEVFAHPFIRTELCDQVQTPAVRELTGAAPVTIRNTQSLVALIQTGRWLSILPQSVVSILPYDCVFLPIAGFNDVRDVCLYRQQETQYPELLTHCATLIERQFSSA